LYVEYSNPNIRKIKHSARGRCSVSGKLKAGKEKEKRKSARKGNVETDEGLIRPLSLLCFELGKHFVGG
jgi:hypothetical protein